MIFSFFKRLGAAEAQAELYRNEAEHLRDRVKTIEKRHDELLEWFLGLNGMAKPGGDLKNAVATGNGEVVHQRPTPTRARDYVRMIEDLERQALGR